MSSGFGLKGGRGRCFPFWQEFAKCYASADHPEDCRLQYEDYQECLFHRKEVGFGITATHRLRDVEGIADRNSVALFGNIG
jgi:NADH dehydrogenase (ubiquinone) Fe-S protein 5